MKKLRALLIYSSFVFLIGCGGGGGGSESSACSAISRIYNGQTCKNSRSVVYLDVRTKKGLRSSCTGTFISQTSILTAAHCLADVTALDSPAQIDVFITGGSTTATGWHVSHLYILTETLGLFKGAFDVAIVKVDENFMPAVGAVPQPLLMSRVPDPGEKVVITGHGLTEKGEQSVDRPKAGTVVLSGIDQYNRLTIIPSEDSAAVCSGDSGGPLLAKNIAGEYGITGITSFTESLQNKDVCGFGTIDKFAPIWNKGNIEFINTHAPDAMKN